MTNWILEAYDNIRNNSLASNSFAIANASTELLLLFLLAPIIGFLAAAIIKRLFGIPGRPLSAWGNRVLRIPHFSNGNQFSSQEQNVKYLNGDKNSIPKNWRIAMINKYKKQKNEIENNDKIDAKFIFGECSDTITIGHALSSGLNLKLICGPKFRSLISKKRLAYLKREYPNQLTVIQLRERPPRHGVRIGNQILIEDFHPTNKEYIAATSIQDASEELIKRFDNYFDWLIDEFDGMILNDERSILESGVLADGI